MSGSLDWFIVDSGLVQEVGEFGKDAQHGLELAAEEFLRAGGVLSWGEWKQLGDASRRAFIKARQRVETERATMLGLAISGPDAALRLYSAVDGGRAAIQKLLADEVVRLREEAKKGAIR